MSNNYIEPDRAYVARQMNGPIISSFIKAVYSFLHKDIDHHANYFKDLSIDTADTEHLVFIGKLMGIQLFTVISDPSGNKYLTYQDNDYPVSEFDYNNGWAEDYLEASDTVTGVFGTGSEQGYPIALANEQYARILSVISLIPSASINSMYAIDTIANVILNSTDYTIQYSEDYPDVINVTLGQSIPKATTSVLQGIFDRLLKGGTTVSVKRR